MKINKPSATERTAFKEKVAKIASEAAESADREAFRRIFTKNQRQQISTYCRKHEIDRGRVIAEIINAGMEAKGIGKKRGARKRP
jgi:hypothetical protein